MNSHQNGIYDLLRALEEAMDKGFPLLSNYMVVVKRDIVESLLDRIFKLVNIRLAGFSFDGNTVSKVVKKNHFDYQ